MLRLSRVEFLAAPATSTMRIVFREGNAAFVILGFLSFLLVGICAISSGSLSLDEFGTWLLTRADSLPDWWRRLLAWPDSDSQIPLYHFLMYIWTKIVGTEVIAMRASNIGMFVIANLALLWPFRSRFAIAVPLVLTSSLNSLLWFYLNEIRPYIMLYMGSCLMVAAVIDMVESRNRSRSLGIRTLCVGAVLSSGATIIGIAWAGSATLFILAYWRAIKRRPLGDLVSKSYLAITVAVLCVAALLDHDIRMFLLGKLPVLAYETNFATVGFSLYTNLGLLGVGPGMLDMRANGVDALLPFIPIVAFSATVFGLVAIGGFLEIRNMLTVGTIVLLIGCIILPVLFIVALGLVLHWRVLPRHLIPLVCLFSILYAFGLKWWWRRRSAGKILALVSILIMGYSSLSVRFAPWHATDDYKHAAELAAVEIAHGGVVWWVADPVGALYYGIPYVSDPREWPQANHGRGALVVGEKVSDQPPPTLVLLSRPDTYDKHNIARNYLQTKNYHLVDSFPAFAAWRR